MRTFLTPSQWQRAQQNHTERLRPILDDYLDQRSQGQKQPVIDFLFEYYAFRPSHLLRWSPGIGTVLQGPEADQFLDQPTFTRTPDGVTLDVSQFPTHRLKSLRWIRDLLRRTSERAPFFGCSGMHEWAMVYKAEQVRHEHIPLRMPPEDIADVVESSPIVCTHHDAFRFFTPEARPLNYHQPTHATMPELEQPGCLHTNMDVYRWAYKFYPWVPSDLIADAFLVALRAREIDMRASPYDLRDYGYEPIRVETTEGRHRYQTLQREITQAAAPLRTHLRAVYDDMLNHLPSTKKAEP